MGGAPASGESSRGGSLSPIKGRSSSEFVEKQSPGEESQSGRSSRRARRASRAEAVGEVESQCVCRSWRSERRSGRRGEAASHGEESQSEALGMTVDGTAAELGGPGEQP